MTQPDESTLISRLRRGDRAALGELLASHQHRLYNICLRLVGNRDDAAELTQEALLKAVRSIDRFRGEAQIATWLTRIATNEALTHLRRQRLRRAASIDAGHPNGDADAHDPPTLGDALADRREPAPHARVQQEEQARALQAALDALTPEFRAVLVLRDVEQMDYQQIAEVLELAVGTVKSRLFRGRLALRQQLADAPEAAASQPSPPTSTVDQQPPV